MSDKGSTTYGGHYVKTHMWSRILGKSLILGLFMKDTYQFPIEYVYIILKGKLM